MDRFVKIFIGDSIFAVSFIIAVICCVIKALFGMSVDGYFLDFVVIGCIIVLYAAARKHNEDLLNVFTAILVLFNTASYIVNICFISADFSGFTDSTCVYADVQMIINILFAGIWAAMSITHFVVMYGHRSHSSGMMLNRILLMALIVLNIVSIVVDVNLQDNYFMLFVDIVGTCASIFVVVMVLCLETRLNTYKSIREKSIAYGIWTKERKKKTKEMFFGSDDGRKHGRISAPVRIVLVVVIVAVCVVGGYLIYMLAQYHRAGNMDLKVNNPVDTIAEAGEEYTLFDWNIGFGAYTQDFDFFMDGGSQSWAESREGLDRNMKDIASVIKDAQADYYVIEEVDSDATRTYHVDERNYLTGALKQYSYTFAPNWDSGFILYPFSQPHGATKAGIMTFSSSKISEAKRVELPVRDGIDKFIDLDRCYSVNRIPVENGKDLVIFSFHLTAYSSDKSIIDTQVNMLKDDMQTEYEKGNYCIAAGDFNMDIIGDAAEYYSPEYEDAAKPIDMDYFSKGNIRLVAPEPDKPTCRYAYSPYFDGQYVVTIDGFLVSDNVETDLCRTVDLGFAYSDHNPVEMTFVLEP